MEGNERILIAIGAVAALVIIAFASTWTYQHFFAEDDLYALGISDKVLVDETATDSGVNDIILAHNQFAFDLYLQLVNGSEENIFFSPFSLFTALMMTYEGAEGNTEAEMSDVLHLPDNNDQRRPAFARVQNDLNDREGRVTLNVANSLWLQEDYGFIEDYLKILEDYYFSEAFQTDFQRDAEGSRHAINDWVSENTNDKIEELLPPGSLNIDTKAVLTNALYFKGDWETGFEKGKTKDENFHVNDERTVKVPMMHTDPDAEDTGYRVNQMDDATVLELPYKGKSISMIFIVPNDLYEGETNTIFDLQIKMDANLYDDARDGLIDEDVAVSMPKFEFEAQYQLKQHLMTLGMLDCFDGNNADFSGISTQTQLSISDVYQNTYINVDETGTEAAAATAVIWEDVASSRFVSLNRPFIFMIQDVETGLILFMGRVMDPSIM